LLSVLLSSKYFHTKRGDKFMEQNLAFKAGIWIKRLFFVFLFLATVVGFYQVIRVNASPLANISLQAPKGVDCALLDNPKARALMSGMFETKLLLQCGRSNELGQAQNAASLPEMLGLDVLVNDPGGDSGPSRTQSETSLAVNDTSGVICSAYNDSYHGVTQGLGYTGFSSSTDYGATWTDHGAIDSNSYGDPATIWRKIDGHFYIGTLHSSGLGLWDLGTECTTATWVGMIHSGAGDDKELLAVDNNPSSPYYGRIYTAWTDFSFQNGHIRSTYSDDKTTWSSPVDISLKDNVQGAWPVVDPVTNDVYVAWVHWDAYPSGPIDIEIVRSTNGGSSFSFVTNPANNVTNPRDAAATSTCGRPALKGNIRYLPSPQIVVDNNSVLHVVYSYDSDGYNTGDVVNVFYRRSTDFGTTWGPEIQLNDDVTTVDQFFPALTVTPSGIVGAFWYDRRLDNNNVNFDYYNAISYDNGLTFDANERISDVSSPVVLDPNLATCYHGDYDTSKSDNTRFFIQWSDDRGGTPDVYLDTDLTRPDFTLTATPEQLGVCAPGDAQYNVAIEPLLGFSDPVTLNASGYPAGTTASFDVNPVIPPGTSLLTIGDTGNAAPGSYSIEIMGIAPTSTHTTTVGLDLFAGVPGVPELLTPADGATDQPFKPSFDWADLPYSNSYNFELDKGPFFETPVVTATGLTDSSFNLTTPLEGGTCYWWRTQADNTCGTGNWSDPFHFSTVSVGVSFSDDIESGDGNWTHAVDQGTDHWTISEAQSHSPTHAWFVPDDSVVTDSRLWNTEPITIGVGSALTFWHQYQFEGSGAYSYDGSILEISTNGGTTWTDLGSFITANGYNGTIYAGFGNPLGGLQAWTGDLTEWTEVSVDLSSFAGQSAQFRWRFGADSSVSDVGWYIDDVQVTSPLPPNPAPVLTAIDPNTGDNRFATPVVITGSGFSGAPVLKLGDTWLEDVVVVDENTISAVVPAGLPKGVYDLMIYNGDCQSGDGLAGAFTVTSVTQIFLPLTVK
jgi:hypothetical protein